MIGRLKRWLAIAGFVALAVVASWFGGKKSAKTDTKLKELDDYVGTRRKMDGVVVGSDPDASRQWLRERGKRTGGV